ncbi:RING finger protein 37-like [Centruroides sculpturatus]|uniref:RING finger protein 37-like n=1 Tax=Centruroides sculpturatus TaxID=218467 RepID=UPI000C6E8174|nr:RING finger protein 37-like [Centruroides sculpturatus]XP_023234751.1 RING finger protein 37-like [Centruroides sculpturatus]XP_023234752.1 RING finger protein 37-like [Centruroides sculpturatus]XP_023234753.1 RING finger protein 37-like [Centruroides sculpturatus]
MAVNFCQEHHSPAISSSHVCRDGYDVTNLIAINQAVRKNGFCAEYFIKPPVNIIIKFPIPIEISHVLLGVKLGEYQTTSLEIWSKYWPTNYDDKDEKFELIGKSTNIIESNVLFANNKYAPRKLFSKLPKNMLPGDVASRRFTAKQYTNLSSIGSLQISLIKVSHSGFPLLSKLEVWGQPARSCLESVVMSVLKAEQNSLPSSSSSSLFKSDKDRFDKLKNLDLDIGKNDHHLDEDELDIPAEFIDPITCSIMTLPIVLPSGHTIDQLTLEKYVKTEASWGRFPNDPFTGVPFNSYQKPVPSASLKVRIDQFLLKNNKLYSEVPRTVGTKEQENSKGRISSLVNSDGKLESTQGTKRSSPESNMCVKKHKLNINNDSSGVMNIFNYYNPISEHQKSSSSPTNEDDLKFSSNLDEALRATLSSCKSYTKPLSEKVNDLLCCVCHSDAILYSLSCLHLLCRECLVQKSKKTRVICDKCHAPSTVGNIVRVHA